MHLSAFLPLGLCIISTVLYYELMNLYGFTVDRNELVDVGLVFYIYFTLVVKHI